MENVLLHPIPPPPTHTHTHTSHFSRPCNVTLSFVQLGKVHINVARLMCLSYKHVSLFHTLHWLPTENSRTDLKQALHAFSESLRSLTGSGSQCLSELHLYTLSRQLLSSSDTRPYRIPCIPPPPLQF